METKVQEIIPTEEELTRQNSFIHRMAWANLLLSFITVGLLIIIVTQVYVATTVKDLQLDNDILKKRLAAIEEVIVQTHKEVKDLNK